MTDENLKDQIILFKSLFKVRDVFLLFDGTQNHKNIIRRFPYFPHTSRHLRLKIRFRKGKIATFPFKIFERIFVNL